MLNALVKKIQLQGECPEVDSQEHEDLMFERITTVCNQEEINRVIDWLIGEHHQHFNRAGLAARTLDRLYMEVCGGNRTVFHGLKLEYRLASHYGFSLCYDRYDAVMRQMAIERATKYPHIVVKDQFYHGTQSASAIIETGFDVSLSGFGQRSLRGLAVSPCELDAKRYAVCTRTPPGPPEILKVEVCLEHVIDLRGCVSSYYIWHRLGLDLLQDLDAREIVQVGNQNNPFFLTDVLQGMGYNGAWVDNTLQQIGPWELCIFSPTLNSVKIISQSGVEQ